MYERNSSHYATKRRSVNEQLHASTPGLQVCLHANNQLTVGKKTHMFRLIVLRTEYVESWKIY